MKDNLQVNNIFISNSQIQNTRINHNSQFYVALLPRHECCSPNSAIKSKSQIDGDAHKSQIQNTRTNHNSQVYVGFLPRH